MIKSSIAVTTNLEVKHIKELGKNLTTLENLILSSFDLSYGIEDIFIDIYSLLSSEVREMVSELNFSLTTPYNTTNDFLDVEYYDADNKIYIPISSIYSKIKNVYLSQLGCELLSRFGKRNLKPINFFKQILTITSTPEVCSIFNPNLKNYMYSVLNSKFEHIYLPLYNTIKTDYDILKPFNIILNETKSNTSSGTNNRTRNLKDTSTLTNDYDLQSDNEDNDSTDKVFAFNDPYGKPVDKNVTSSTRTSKSTSTDTEDTSRTGTDNYSTSRSDTESRNYTRAGNIGNRTNAQLIEEERKKLMFDLREYIINDITDSLCAGTWSD